MSSGEFRTEAGACTRKALILWVITACATRRKESAALELRFQARIDAEERIEPKDWMPDTYRGR